MFRHPFNRELIPDLSSQVAAMPRELDVEEAIYRFVEQQRPETLVFVGVGLPAFDFTASRIVAELTSIGYDFGTAAGLALMHKNHDKLPSELMDPARQAGGIPWVKETMLKLTDVIDGETGEIFTTTEDSADLWALRQDVEDYAAGRFVGKTGTGRTKARLQRSTILNITEEMQDSFSYFAKVSSSIQERFPDWPGKFCIIPVPGATLNITFASESLDGKVANLLADERVSLRLAAYAEKQHYMKLIEEACGLVLNGVKLILQYSQFSNVPASYLVQIYKELNPIIDQIFRGSDATRPQDGENIFGSELRRLIMLRLDLGNLSMREVDHGDMDFAISEAMLRCHLSFRLCLKFNIEKATNEYTTIVEYVTKLVAEWKDKELLAALFQSTKPFSTALKDVVNWDISEGVNYLATRIEQEL